MPPVLLCITQKSRQNGGFEHFNYPSARLQSCHCALRALQRAIRVMQVHQQISLGRQCKHVEVQQYIAIVAGDLVEVVDARNGQ